MAISSPAAFLKWVGIPDAMMKCGWNATSTYWPPGRTTRNASR